MLDVPSYQRRGALVDPGHEGAWCDVPGGRGEKISRLIVGLEQPLDFATQQLISAACRFEERAAVGRRPLQRGVVDVLDLPPAIGCHQTPLSARTRPSRPGWDVSKSRRPATLLVRVPGCSAV